MKIEITVPLIVVSVFLITACLVIWYLLASKSRKRIIEQAKKDGKKERQIVLGHGYKEINDLKKELKKEKEAAYKAIELEHARLDNDKLLFEKMTANLNMREQKLSDRDAELVARSKQLSLLNDELTSELENISGLKKEEAKRKLMKAVEKSIAQEANVFLKNQEMQVRLQAKEKAANILIESMEKYWTKIVDERTISTIKIEDDDLKGRIIGKEGRNIRAFEQYGGVDLIIDETPNVVQVSSFNPIRREIAVRALKKLIEDGRIQPVRIEQELINQEKMLEEHILEVGQEVINELGIEKMSVELIRLVGRLKYRTSYSQNVLTHSIEVAKISGQIARELNLNVDLAMRAGLLHDIGKAIDFEQEGNHVSLGVDFCKRYDESPIVINAIAAHHEDIPKDNIYSVIVAMADGISASRPGARNNQLDDFIRRMSEIEKICNTIPGVVKSYAVQSGRQIRVIVDPIKINDLELMDLSNKIREQIRQKVIIPGEITLTLIRENRSVQKF